MKRKLKQTGWAAIFRALPNGKKIYVPMTQQQVSGSLVRLPECRNNYAKYFRLKSVSIVIGTHNTGFKVKSATAVTRTKTKEKETLK